MVKLKEPNPLNVFGIRRTKIQPKHFESIAINYTYNMEEEIGRAHVRTPVTEKSRMPSSA